MIADFAVNEEVVGFFFVSDAPTVRKSKKDKDYLCLKLQDKSGTIDARVWDYPLGFNPDSIKKGSFIKARGSISEWQDVKQIAINAIRLAEAADGLDYGDFFERSERDPEEMYQELRDLLETNVREPHLDQLLRNLIEKNKENFCLAPAAKGVHHAYLAGLLEHVLSMSKAAIPMCDHYGLNKSLVLTGCVTHDFAKIWELTYPIGIGYSLIGTTVGHVSMGMMAVAEEMKQIPGFPDDLKIAVLHLIASHHGLLAYGAAKVPLMREAIALHLIDMMDAKMAICARAVKAGLDENGLTAWVRELEGPLWKGPEEYEESAGS